MKKIKIILVLLFAIFVVSGCSCTSSMCTKADTDEIKKSIRSKYDTDEYKATLREQAIAKDITDENAIATYIQTSIEETVKKEYNSHPKACLTIENMEDPDSGAIISGKTWIEAFKTGLLEGLIVYPISWLLITFISLFGGSGFAKISSIIVTTFIIKSLMLLFTFKQQVQLQKMQAIQPEITEISKKLNDPNLSQNEKYRLQMKMMDLYKKNNINPFATLIPQLISIPIFLSVWSAVSQTLPIRTGEFLGIELGVSVSTQVFSLDLGSILLFLLMCGFQILSMKLPNIIRKRQANYKNKSNLENSGQMNTMMNVMVAMILVTGFMLPAALAVYWTVGAIFSILQTLVFSNSRVKEKLSGLGNRKKKAKVVQ